MSWLLLCWVSHFIAKLNAAILSVVNIVMLNIAFYCYAEYRILLLCWMPQYWLSLCRFAECHIFFIVMLNVMPCVIMPLFWASHFYCYADVITPSVIMLSVIMLNVVTLNSAMVTVLLLSVVMLNVIMLIVMLPLLMTIFSSAVIHFWHILVDDAEQAITICGHDKYL